MPKSEEEYRRIREAQRENILTAAKIAVLRYGWAATMADIASEAKISQGLAYRYFDSKETIFAELFDQMLEKMMQLSENATESSSPALRLRALIDRMLGKSDIFGNFEMAIRASYEKSSEQCLADYMRCGHEKDRKLIEVMKLKLNLLKDMVVGIIEEGQKNGDFIMEDPQKLTLMLLSAIKGLTHMAIHQNEMYKSYYPYTDLIMRLVINPYKASASKETSA